MLLQHFHSHKAAAVVTYTSRYLCVYDSDVARVTYMHVLARYTSVFLR